MLIIVKPDCVHIHAFRRKVRGGFDPSNLKCFNYTEIVTQA